MPARRIGGFTLMELMIGLTIVGVLLAIGAPSFSTWLQASKLSSASQVYLVGVQTARTEAIRRNVPVQFVLTDTALDTSDLANSIVAAPNGRNWVVRAASGAAFVLVESRSAAESGFQAGAGTSVQIAGTGNPTLFDGTITFNGFGGTADNSVYDLEISNPGGGNCAASSPAGPMRCQRVQVRGGGQVRLCDPAASGVADTRSCA